MSKVRVQIREANSEDISFIFSSWLKSFKTSKFAKSIGSNLYYSGHHILIENLLKRSKVLVACNSTDVGQIYGFGVGEMRDNVPIVHFIYVKHKFRKFKIGTALFEDLINKEEGEDYPASFFTHLTKSSDASCHLYNAIYYPHLAFEGFTLKKEEENAEQERVETPVSE